jgi:UDP-N-acetylglucosamine 4,6-dehydratase
MDEAMNKFFKNKNILITGGTGFLGRALVKEILKYKPHGIRVFGRDEVKHHNVQEEFNYNPTIRHLIGDVRDYARLNRAAEGVDIVIHAAALKRIDILEYNVEEVVKTNIIGTLNVANACWENNVKMAIFVSSDKACLPVNTYGACKFVGERIFTESNYSRGMKRVKFISVRYGNVLESTGSVIPFFESKIKNNKTITLTDPRMTRFLISPEDAVQLIFNAIKYGIGGEVFVPKLPAFKIIDLIDILKEKHNSNVKVKIIGLRPGEKMHELMINSVEASRTYKFKNGYVITSQIEKYRLVEKAKYRNEKNKLTENDEYCSKDALINKNEVKKIFKKLKLI